MHRRVRPGLSPSTTCRNLFPGNDAEARMHHADPILIPALDKIPRTVQCLGCRGRLVGREETATTDGAGSAQTYASVFVKVRKLSGVECV